MEAPDQTERGGKRRGRPLGRRPVGRSGFELAWRAIVARGQPFPTTTNRRVVPENGPVDRVTEKARTSMTVAVLVPTVRVTLLPDNPIRSYLYETLS